jgi:superfamily II DNA or RNA helicase
MECAAIQQLGGDTSVVTMPEMGHVVRVRNRTGVMVRVDPAPVTSKAPANCLVDVAYDDGQQPSRETLLWSLEEGHTMSGSLADLSLADSPLPQPRLKALIRAATWSSGTVHSALRSSAEDVPSLLAPIYCPVAVAPHQLVPLQRALEMPRIRLLLADDVGLGKTVEAGLIIAELILRRRIRRVLVLCPPALRTQWQTELWRKFSLSFDVTDGRSDREWPDGNPWSGRERVIASYHYLRRPEVLEQFTRSCRGSSQPHLPWDLLVVDEVHHLMHRGRGKESAGTRMLRNLARWFEHRLFLSATPHDGYGASFTGLLELLDPLRFRRTAHPTPAERQHMRRVVIRRTRNQLDHAGPERLVTAVPVRFAEPEAELFKIFGAWRDQVASWGRYHQDQTATGVRLAVEVLNRRLLSSLPAFAMSFAPFRQGLMQSARGFEATAAPDSRWKKLATILGAWMTRYYPDSFQRIEELTQALTKLGINLEEPACFTPVIDSRIRALRHWVDAKLRTGAGWKSTERAIIFTEYQATLDYLTTALAGLAPDGPDRILTVSATTPMSIRQARFQAFSDSRQPVSLLLATDVASEGLNLQHASRNLFHYDLPWNPAVLEQRIGRVDRMGQTRRVQSFHFVEARELGKSLVAGLTSKTRRINEDIGAFRTALSSSSEKSPEARHRALLFPDRTAIQSSSEGTSVTRDPVPRQDFLARLEETQMRLGASPQAQKDTLLETLRISRPDARLLEITPGVYRADNLDVQTAGSLEALLTRNPPQASPDRLALTFNNMNAAHLMLTPDEPGHSGLRPYHVRPGHPLFAWAKHRLLNEAWNRGGKLPWTAILHSCTTGLLPGICLIVVEQAINQQQQVLHDALRLLHAPFRKTPVGWRLGSNWQIVPPAIRQVLLTTNHLSHSQLTDDIRLTVAAALPAALQAWTIRQEKQLSSVLSIRLIRARSNLKRSFKQRKIELDMNNTPALQKRISNLESAVQSGVLFADLEGRLQQDLKALRAELNTSDEKRQLRARELIQSMRILKRELPDRYTLKPPMTVILVAALFIVTKEMI